jgi:hypothetical protein
MRKRRTIIPVTLAHGAAAVDSSWLGGRWTRTSPPGGERP